MRLTGIVLSNTQCKEKEKEKEISTHTRLSFVLASRTVHAFLGRRTRKGPVATAEEVQYHIMVHIARCYVSSLSC